MAAIRIAFYHDSFYPNFKPFYEAVAQRGVEFAGSLAIENGHFVCRDADGKQQESLNCDYVAAGAQNQYLSYKKPLLALGIPEERIIDSFVFFVPGIDLSRFFADGTVIGTLPPGLQIRHHTNVLSIPQQLSSPNFSLRLGRLSSISNAIFDGRGFITVKDFSSISWELTFELGLNGGHHAERVFTHDWVGDIDWPEFQIDKEPMPLGHITIGSDVWIGRGCHLKSASQRHPLTIGDGAIIASDSNVVKDVPPYAIVGGNPARFIRWRFPENIRKGLQKIRWWDWPLEKIHAARLEMKDPSAFVEKYLSEAK